MLRHSALRLPVHRAIPRVCASTVSTRCGLTLQGPFQPTQLSLHTRDRLSQRSALQCLVGQPLLQLISTALPTGAPAGGLVERGWHRPGSCCALWGRLARRRRICAPNVHLANSWAIANVALPSWIPDFNQPVIKKTRVSGAFGLRTLDQTPTQVADAHSVIRWSDNPRFSADIAARNPA